jgi:PAS domain S-box-containing protein
MSDNTLKSKSQLSEELDILRQRVAELESLEKKRKDTEEALTIQNKYLDELFESSPDAIVILNNDDRIMRINREFSRVFGYTEEEAIGELINDLIVPEELKNEATDNTLRVAGGDKIEAESIRKSKNGKIIHVSIIGKPVFLGGIQLGVYAIYRDITRRKIVEEEQQQLEKQLRQAQKMEAIGTLAGGIAHDFNNILGVIFGYAELAVEEVPPDSRSCKSVKRIIKAADKAKDLVQQILIFSRQVEQKQKPLRIAPIIKEAMKLLRSTLPSTIDFRINIGAEQSVVMADPTQIQQVVMNLCVNAGHAMRETGGILSITLEETRLDADEAADKEINPGPYVLLSVKDTGHGIREDILKRIFDPYFTTKEKEEGTGLGLAVVHGIIKKHEGDISVTSVPAQGTVFEVFLPCVEDEAEEPVEELTPVPGGSERILFIDDEQVLVEIARRMLEKLGYRVDARTGSVEAVEAFRNHPEAFDLVITDQTMPNMTGLQLVEEMRNIRPDIPIILCTGFSDVISKENYRSYGIDGFVLKPIIKREIATAIRSVLEKKE